MNRDTSKLIDIVKIEQRYCDQPAFVRFKPPLNKNQTIYSSIYVYAMFSMVCPEDTKIKHPERLNKMIMKRRCKQCDQIRRHFQRQEWRSDQLVATK